MNIYQLKYNNLDIISTPHTSVNTDDLKKLEANSAEKIFGGNILELIDDTYLFLMLIESKLRLSGEFIISGINIDNICENYLDNIIDIDALNKLIINKKRIFNLQNIISLIKQAGMIPKTIKTDGIYYYISVSRKNTNE